MQYLLPPLTGEEVVSGSTVPALILGDKDGVAGGTDPSHVPVLTEESVTLNVRTLELLQPVSLLHCLAS